MFVHALRARVLGIGQLLNLSDGSGDIFTVMLILVLVLVGLVLVLVLVLII